MLPETLRWKNGINGTLELIDQRLLPATLEYLTCETTEQVFDAIKTLVVRGAPAIGVTAAYGAVIAARRGTDLETCLTQLKQGAEYLNKSRPTAVNLSWALNRMAKHADKLAADTPTREQFLDDLLAEAKAIDREDRTMCRNIGKHGSQFIENNFGVLTHCNAGSLATTFYGTALAVIYHAWESGKRFKVYADETRPVMQGSRLTHWELNKAGIDATLICDSMAGYAMQLDKINMVVVGADRIAANGDVANKIGTYSVAVLAQKHNIPFYVAAPASTFDLSLTSGADIPIEQRNPDEIRKIANHYTANTDADVWNPAFDITPAELITAIITNRGVIETPTTEKIASFFTKPT